MSVAKFNGEIKARIIEVRFAISGKVAVVSKFAGDKVTKGNLIASLDKKILQTELDKQLADYERTRADFEIFNMGKGEPADDLSKYLKTQKQAQLNISVKEVELAKCRLDMCDLISPIEGIILDDSSITPGIYTTPASSPIKIIDTKSFFFEFEVKQKDIFDFEKSIKGQIKIDGQKTIEGETSPVFSDSKRFFVKIPVTDSPNLLLGMKGEVQF